jgi:hypothetical protein
VTTTIVQRIAALQQMRVPELVAEYERVYGRPPHCRNRTWLWRNVAWKVQELAYGGLPADAAARLEEIIETHIRPRFEAAAAGRKARDARQALPPGTVLTRDWHERTVRLEVTDAGFVVDGVPYTSLSAAANAVTGQRWNGRLFWGLRKRTAKRAS